MKKRVFGYSSVLLFMLATCLGCSGDEFSTVILSGQATFPPEFTGRLGEVVPVSNTPFQVIDLARASNANLVATGATDPSGNYAITVPVTTSVAVVVLGEVRVSGLIDPRRGSVSKSFDGITDIACQAGVTALTEGAIDSTQLDEERISNLELAASVVAGQMTVDFSDADGSRTAAAAKVREITEDGDHPPA